MAPSISGSALFRSWLFAPANNPHLLQKVFGVGADAVVLDLEDSVPFEEKARARDLVTETLAGLQPGFGPAVWVRLSSPDPALAAADIDAAMSPALAGIRVPKVESASHVATISALIASAEKRAGIEAGNVRMLCALETAQGVWAAHDIVTADPRVEGTTLGALDLAADLGFERTVRGLESVYVRSHLVLVSRVAGVRPPVDSSYPALDDDEGLARSTRQGRQLGFFGRGCIHPRQVPIVNESFTPSTEEVERAQKIVAAAEHAEELGIGSLRMSNGDFVDLPVLQKAKAILTLHLRLSASS